MSDRNSSRLPTYVECIYTVGVRNRCNSHYYCMTCFSRLGIISILRLEIVASHYFVQGPYKLYFCAICHKNIVRAQPVTHCALCINKYYKLLNDLRFAGIDPNNFTFNYNIFKETLVRIR